MFRLLLAAVTGFAGIFAMQSAGKVFGPFQVFGPPVRGDIDAKAFALAKARLVQHEGRESVAYVDTEGYLTVGIGHKVLPGDRIVKGQRITEERIEALFAADIAGAFEAAKRQAADLGKYDADFIAALTEVNFQLGSNWPSVWKNTYADLKRGSIASAIARIRQSKWARQTPVRVANFIEAIGRAYT